MPELPEIHLFSHLINEKSDTVTFTSYTCDGARPFHIPQGDFTMSAKPNGKEMLVCFHTNADSMNYLFHHGLVGQWKWTNDSAFISGQKIRFHSSQGDLVFVDQMWLGKWVQQDNFTKTRSPDPVLDFKNFCINVIKHAKKKPAGDIFSFMEDQKVFNGIGNYLRSEILHRAGLSHSVILSDIFKNVDLPINYGAITPQSNIGEIFLYLCRQVPLEIIQLKLNKYGNHIEKAEFNEYLRVYGKSPFMRINKRLFYYSVDQLAGEKIPEIGEPILEYPYEKYLKIPSQPVSKRPTAFTKNMIAPTQSGSLIDLIDKQLPPITILYTAISNLNQKSALSYNQFENLQNLMIKFDPQLYSILKVFIATRDEEDFVDSLTRL